MVHICLAPLTILLCLPEGCFHSPHVPEAAEVSLATCASWAMPCAGPYPSPAVLPTSQIHGNVGVHRVTPQPCHSSSFGVTPGTHLWNPSPSHPKENVLWEQAYINVHFFQLSFCYFLFAFQLFYSPFHMWFLSFSIPFLPVPWQGDAMHTSPPEPQ